MMGAVSDFLYVTFETLAVSGIDVTSEIFTGMGAVSDTLCAISGETASVMYTVSDACL